MEKMNSPDFFTFSPRPEPVKYFYPARKKELLFAAGILIFSLLSVYCLFYRGANLGYMLGYLGLLGCTTGYFISQGHRPDRYTGWLLGLCACIAGAYLYSDDRVLEILTFPVLLSMPSLAFCLMAGQNRRSPGGFLSLLDGPRAFFALGIGRMGEATRGLRLACRATGTIGKTGGAVLLGLVIAVPLLTIMIPLLISADAAFEGLLALLPKFDVWEAAITAIFGLPLAWVLYTRATALHYNAVPSPAQRKSKGMSSLTVNTVLICISLMYLIYLISQLAYFFGGFAGILPEEYTLAQYARRGFFEMAWLCSINLGLIALSMGLITARRQPPLSSKLIALFLGLVTVLLVATASAKMLLYIRSYGLTRMRVLTEVFMVWLALTTVFVCIWLFRPQFAYMKPVLVVGLVLCAILMWGNVEGQVARYNVCAYQSGMLETIDVRYLGDLGYGAIPYLEELTRDADPAVAEKALHILKTYPYDSEEPAFNLTYRRAAAILALYQEPPAVN